jgi:hypothetical protein
MSSPPLTVQKINMVKPFFLQSRNFLLLNGEIGRSQVKVMDKKIRGMINKELKIKGLPIECHHASWRDGGLAYSNMGDRGDVLTIQSFAQVTLSDDMGVRPAMRQFIEDEREFRRIETDINAQFFD